MQTFMLSASVPGRFCLVPSYIAGGGCAFVYKVAGCPDPCFDLESGEHYRAGLEAGFGYECSPALVLVIWTNFSAVYLKFASYY